MKIFTISGPQASGKSTVWNFLRDKYGDVADFYEEMNQDVLFPNKARLGSVDLSAEMERELHDADVRRIGEMSSDRLSVVETFMFHAVYFEDMLGKEFYDEGMEDYRNALVGKDVYVLFIDTTPDVSFSRRKKIYMDRLDREIKNRGMVGDEAREFKSKMMDLYLHKIELRYPIWKRVFNDIDYAKEKFLVKNDDLSRDELLRRAEEIFLKVLSD